MERNAELTYRIAPAAEQDLSAILELQKRAFHGQALIYHDFTLPSLTQSLDDLKEEFRKKTFYKLEIEARLAGSVRCFMQGDAVYIEKLIVEPGLQNQGIGTSIMRQIEVLYADRVKRYALSTGDKSARNLHLYKKLGYRESGREPLNENCMLIRLEKMVS